MELNKYVIVMMICAFIIVPATHATSYFYAGDDILAEKHQGETIYHYRDRVGSTVLSSQGEENTNYRYLPFGQEITSIRRFGFEKKELDTSGLLYSRARYLDANLGRFTSIDPIRDDHAYNFVDNNPLAFIDPTGLADEEVDQEEKTADSTSNLEPMILTPEPEMLGPPSMNEPLELVYGENQLTPEQLRILFLSPELTRELKPAERLVLVIIKDPKDNHIFKQIRQVIDTYNKVDSELNDDQMAASLAGAGVVGVLHVTTDLTDNTVEGLQELATDLRDSFNEKVGRGHFTVNKDFNGIDLPQGASISYKGNKLSITVKEIMGGIQGTTNFRDTYELKVGNVRMYYSKESEKDAYGKSISGVSGSPHFGISFGLKF